jgi:hypothetical protein
VPGDLETRIRFERYSTRADHRGSSIWNRYGDQLKRGEAGTLRWQNEAALFLVFSLYLPIPFARAGLGRPSRD